MGIPTMLLKVPFTSKTGYGNDGFSLARAFTEAGIDVRVMPSWLVPPIPMACAMLLVKDLDVDYDYVVHHVDPGQLGLSDGEKRLPAKKIAWTMWEFTGMAPEIAPDLAERLDGYDLLLVYDEVSRQALAPFAEQAGVPVRILQGGVWADDWQGGVTAREWSGTFRFCMVGQLHDRKNPFAAVDAFNKVHAEYPDTELHLKTTVRYLHPKMEEAYPGVKIHYTVWNHQQMRDFYTSCHTYVAPSWGEGKNLPALEAQLMGIPVIYSDFGGHRQWGSSETGWPVKGTLAEHVEGMGSYRVDPDDLVRCMTEAVAHRHQTRAMGEKASRMIPAQCDWSVVVRRLLETV